MQGYSTTMWYGVTRILQESKTFQINIFFSAEHKMQASSTTIFMELQRSKRLALATITLI